MLKIKDSTGKLVGTLKDEDTSPQMDPIDKAIEGAQELLETKEEGDAEDATVE
jgi:hypothetical protein